MANDAPVRILSKIERWGRRFGSINAKFGMFFGGKRGGKGSSSNSGPVGKRAKRWYPGRATRNLHGKHWPKKFQPKKGMAAK